MLAEGTICRDCRRMEELADGEVQLVVSGPPYWDYIDYAGYARGKRKCAVAWTGTQSYEEYLDRFTAWHRECFRVLEPGRFCVVTVAGLQRDGKTYPLPFHAVSRLEELGFEFRFEIIWHKIVGARRTARAFLQSPRPGNFQPNNAIEYLLVFRKPGKSALQSRRQLLRRLGDAIPVDDFVRRELANNVWHLLPATPGPNRRHPCPFPPEIPYRLIQLFSLTGDLVLDPFAGIGTTGRAARMLGRRYIGYELVPEFVEEAQRTLDTPLRLREPLVIELRPPRIARKKSKP